MVVLASGVALAQPPLPESAARLRSPRAPRVEPVYRYFPPPALRTEDVDPVPERDFGLESHRTVFTPTAYVLPDSPTPSWACSTTSAPSRGALR